MMTDTLLGYIQGADVEWKTLGEACDTLTAPSKLTKKFYQQSGKIPIIDQGEKFIAGYADGIYKTVSADRYVVFGDHSEHIKFVDFEFIQGADGLKILKAKPEVDAKFLYYAFKNFYQREQSYKRHWTKAKETKIPIPSLKTQKKVVEILDKMTDYVTELTAELTLRQKQYSYYRDQLLAFPSQSDSDESLSIKWTTLGEVARLKNGSDWKNLTAGDIPVYGSGGEMNAKVGKSAYNKPTVLIPRKGSISNLFYLTKPFWNVDTIYYTEIDDKQIVPKFFYYFLQTANLEGMSTNPTRPSLTQAILDKVSIPLPPLKLQFKIVEILDKFQALTEDVSGLLPEEIALREKQYTYYREQLLTFSTDSARASH